MWKCPNQNVQKMPYYYYLPRINNLFYNILYLGHTNSGNIALVLPADPQTAPFDSWCWFCLDLIWPISICTKIVAMISAVIYTFDALQISQWSSKRRKHVHSWSRGGTQAGISDSCLYTLSPASLCLFTSASQSAASWNVLNLLLTNEAHSFDSNSSDPAF